MKPVDNITRRFKILRVVGIVGILTAGVVGSILLHATGASPLAISQSPLQMTSPIRPEVVIAVTNSESMDGNMSGAIMTGSGFPVSPASASYGSLLNSSSPANYTVPAGFTAPVSLTASGGTAPYTVNVSGTLYDNSESRLNLAKATISNIVSTYLQTTDFALVSYDPPSVSVGNTWVYYMSPYCTTLPCFTFNNTGPAGTTTAGNGITSTTTIINPCYNYLSSTAPYSTSSSVNSYCSGIAGRGGITSTMLNSNQYMTTSASSDDANINDVLYSGSLSTSPFAVAFDYGTVSGKNNETITSSMTPYYNATTNTGGYTLSDFKNGNVLVGYSGYSCCVNATGPTNAGFVPYTPQTMYSLRGFGYSSGKTVAATTSSSSSGYVAMTNLGASGVTSTTINSAVATFTPALQPETNSTSTHELKSKSGQSPVGLLMTGAKNAFVVGGTGRPCASPQFVILVTDGQPTEDSTSSHYYWPPLGSDSATALGVTASFGSDNSLVSSNDQAVIDAYNAVRALNTGTSFTAGAAINSGTPNQVGNVNSSYIYTYVIGLGNGANGTSPVQQGAQNVLNALAYAGGTGSYYPATNPAQVQLALNAIMLDIQSHTLATVASSANSTHLSTNSVEYQATFTASEPTNLDWTGELYAEPLTASGIPTGTKSWSARALLTTAAPSSRAIATWTPTATATGTGVPFQVPGATGGGISTAQGTAITPTTTQFGSPLPATATMSNALQYLRGDSTNELAPIGSGVFRKRTWHLGDIVNSQPTFVGPSTAPYTSDPTYITYATNNQSRTGMIYVGANDGMLHAFVAATGVEQFAFIPNGVFSNLTNLTVPSYNINHQFFVDGSPQTADVKFTDARGWTTMLLGGEGGGGRSIYALDITNPTANTEATVAITPSATNRPWVLWEYNGDGSDHNMGLSYSNPTVALTNVVSSATGSTNGFVVFFGNGYNSPNQSAVLYALNPQTGASLFATSGSGSTFKGGLDLCAAVTNICDTSLPNGLSSVAVGSTSGNPSQPITTVYAGDLQGNLWAIDVSNASPSNWVVRCLYNGTKYNSSATFAAQPITTTPTVSLAPNYPAQQGLFVLFATGQLLTPSDLTNLTTQSVYGIWDVPGDSANQPYANSVLQQQSLTYVSAATSGFPQAILTSTSTSINWGTQRGWYVNLAASGIASGYRVLSDPVLFNAGLQFVMNSPPSTTVCGSTWSSYFLDLNYATGGSFGTAAHLDANGDGTVNSLDLYTTGGVSTAPTGLSLGSGFAGGINNFGLSGLSIVTISNIADAGSIASAITALDIARANNAAASASPTSTSAASAEVAAAQAAVNAITAALNANPGNAQLVAALAQAQLALTAALNAQSETGSGDSSDANAYNTQAANYLKRAEDLLKSTQNNNTNIYTLLPLFSSYPWWQVL